VVEISAADYVKERCLYLPQKEFAAVVAEFFGRPEDRVLGWERAVDAQTCIITATTSIFARSSL
jgi:hypothetical protein